MAFSRSMAQVPILGRVAPVHRGIFVLNALLAALSSVVLAAGTDFTITGVVHVGGKTHEHAVVWLDAAARVPGDALPRLDRLLQDFRWDRIDRVFANPAA